MRRPRPLPAARLVGAIVFVEALLFAALAPLLPHYVAAADLGETGAGLLVAAFPAGVVAGSLPSGWLVGRVGARWTTVAGLLLLAGAGVAFAFAGSPAALEASRFVQGLGSAAAWTGGLVWVAAATPAERRGAAVGTVLGFAVAGTIAGPAVGVLAGATGTAPAFCALAAIAAALALGTAAASGGERSAPAAAGRGRRRLGRGVLVGAALIAVVGMFIGVVDAVMPLRLDGLGATRAAIGAAFLVAAVLQSALSPLLGRLVDRHGALAVAAPCLAATAALAALAPLPDQALGAALALVLGATAAGSLWVPGMTLLGSGAGQAAVSPYGFAVGNLVWSAAQVVGAGGGARLGALGGAELPFWLLAGFAALVLAATLLPAQRRAVTSTRVP